MKFLSIISMLVLSISAFGNIADYGQVTNAPRIETRKHPRVRYPFAPGRTVTVVRKNVANQRYFIKVRIEEYFKDQSQIRFTYLEGDRQGEEGRTNIGFVMFAKGCTKGICAGDNVLVKYQGVPFSAKLKSFMLKTPKNYKIYYAIKLTDSRFPSQIRNKTKAYEAQNVYSIQACGSKKLCPNDIAYLGPTMARKFFKVKILGANEKGQYMAIANSNQYLYTGNSFSDFTLATKEACGKTYCTNDLVTYKRTPNDHSIKSLIKGVNHIGKYLIQFIEGRSRGKFLPNVTNGHLKK